MRTCRDKTYCLTASIQRASCSVVGVAQYTVTCVGTIHANRRGIPVEIKQLDSMEPLLYECFWETVDNKVSVYSYVINTKSPGKQNALLLTTMQPIFETTKNGGKKKTAIYKSRY